MWSLFVGWLLLASVCAILDMRSQRSLYLPAFMAVSVVAVLAATWKYRTKNYKFSLVKPGTVRSQFGFEIEITQSRIDYKEGDHVISWKAAMMDAGMGRVELSNTTVSAWEDPFSNELLGSEKKTEIVKRVKAAIIYLQLVETGKIRPSRN